ncbi:hypothetical protein fnug_125 [Pseudomonas phage fnug]|uniref:PHIKZ105 n=4 Tax=Viruses TaxID=10239 RepID=Q8SD57_BPDPK|nr:PHIKZ105 [Pseudomonas phage phiKZ]YP_009617562.1 hypothetical protein FDI90_gp274 [Pseudomonas phage PA7]MBG7006423.1 hypothetical protein [Pseudomonas aeruginosa]QGK90126.1 hypothetical protein [Pseudomonas phage vB_PA32_GUMS]QJB22768.1 hypothetical protein fnug_125 [Pseudomonas phage fnug]QOV07980.1 hypothetical protein [Pseudomonas phage vB_PaeM_kmuB]UNI71734.1 hypothetical protein Churi01_gp226 [Pseudomonas phage Churi01]WAX23654.1 hypothetical protein [Pseudomonas phage pPA-N1803-4At
MAKTKKQKVQEAITRKLIKFYSDTFPELMKAIENCDSSGEEHNLHNVFDNYKKTIKMAEEAKVDLSLYGVNLIDKDTYTSLLWFIEGCYVWDMIKKLNKAKYDNVPELARITQWDELDDAKKLQFNKSRDYIIKRLKEVTTCEHFRNY